MCPFHVHYIFKYLTCSEDLVYCGPFPAITTLVIANDCLYMGHKPIVMPTGVWGLFSTNLCPGKHCGG